MSDSVNVSGPIEITDNSKERVALDLMKIIARAEPKSEQKRDVREHYLTLYFQCLKATTGYDLKSILKVE